MLQTQGKEQRDGTGTIRRTADGRGGGNQTHCALDEKWREVNRQCHSRKRTKYIYINSLFYNHDKQQKKHSHKNINFEIINSTSVSDNSFFPPATQSTKLHSVKGYI